jgi:acetyl esterase/lipase
MEWINLWKDETITAQHGRPAVLPFLLDEPGVHPAVLVIPGGGYGMVCEPTEGTPTAREFNKLGYHAFVLNYRTAPSRWPEPQLDAMRAMKIIRANAGKWGVQSDRIAVCGFSAGGHLAGSLGTICRGLDASDGDEADKFSHVPDMMILCYGVLAFEPWSENGTQRNLLGEDYETRRQECSLPEHVGADTPPAYLLHTIGDQLVPYRNSMEFANAMAAAGIPCELQLDNWGDHGMLLGRTTLDTGMWMERAHRFMQILDSVKKDPEYLKRYTHLYQVDRLD